MMLVKLLYILSLLLGFLFENVQSHLDGEAIIGGDIAPSGEYKYQVSLQIYNNHFCGGSILDDYHAITAAHCVTNSDERFMNYPIKVVAGINDLKNTSSSKVSVSVKKVFIPKEYRHSNSIPGDIAVLQLSHSLNIDSNEALSKIQLPQNQSYEGGKAIISGFGWNWVNTSVDSETGQVIENGGGTYGKLRFAVTKIDSKSDCQKFYGSKIMDKHICAHVIQRSIKAEGVCSGDSGGPLVYNGTTLIGTVSTSPIGCKEDIAPAIYTRVSSYLDFISKAIKNVNDPGIRTTILPDRH